MRQWLRLRRPLPPHLATLLGATFLGALFVAWAAATGSGAVNPLFLPTPSAIIRAGIEGIRDGTLLADTRVSLTRITVGWLLSTLAAIPIGTLMGSYPFFNALLEPFVGFIRYLPVPAFVPLSILWFGVDERQKLVLLFIGTFFQEVLMIADNVRAVPQPLLESSATFGFGDREILRRVIVPYALPGMMDTMRITLGWTWTYLVLAEEVAATRGLGHTIMLAQRYLAPERILLGIFVIGLLGMVSDLLFQALTRKLFPWARGVQR